MKHNHLRLQIERKQRSLVLFSTFFYWKLHQREKKKQLIKPKSNPNIHRCTDSFSKITHTEQRVRGVTMSSSALKQRKVKNKQKQQKEKTNKKQIKNRSAVLINSSSFYLVMNPMPNTLLCWLSLNNLIGHFLVISGFCISQGAVWTLLASWLAALLGLCGQSIALIKGGPKHQLKSTGPRSCGG